MLRKMFSKFRRAKRKKSNSEQTLSSKFYDSELKYEATKQTDNKAKLKEGHDRLGNPCLNTIPIGDQTKQKDIRRVGLRSMSLVDLTQSYKSEECTCNILLPEPALPGSPPVDKRVLLGSSQEYSVFITRSGNNVFRLIARKSNDELFLNLTLNEAKYTIVSNTWHEIESSETTRKRLIVLNFLVGKPDQLASFHKFFDSLLNFLHRKKTLSRVQIFYPPGYNYENLLSQNYGKEGTGSDCMFGFGQELRGPLLKMSPEDINSLTAQLSNFLEVGNVAEASKIAATLAEQKVKVQMEVLHSDTVEEEEPELSVKVCVEDKDTSGASIMINVRPYFTVGMLKKKIQKDYGFPEVIQKWIIGQAMPKDPDLLTSCGITGPGCTMFLYLVSCRSVGLNKETFLARERDQSNENTDNVPRNTSSDDNNVYISMNFGGNRVMPVTEPAEDLTPTFPPPVPPSDRHPPDCHLGRKNPPPVPTKPPPVPTKPPPRSKAAPGPQVSQPAQSTDGFSLQATQAVLTAMLDPPTETQASSQRNALQGWICPQCTYINIPTRPGCEMCTASCPVDYKIPDDFTIPEEEQERLNLEHQLDIQAQNVGAGDQRGRGEARGDNSGEDLLTAEELEQLLNVDNRITVPTGVFNPLANELATDRALNRIPALNPPHYPVMESVPTEHSESDDDNIRNDDEIYRRAFYE